MLAVYKWPFTVALFKRSGVAGPVQKHLGNLITN